MLETVHKIVECSYFFCYINFPLNWERSFWNENFTIPFIRKYKWTMKSQKTPWCYFKSWFFQYKGRSGRKKKQWADTPATRCEHPAPLPEATHCSQKSSAEVRIAKVHRAACSFGTTQEPPPNAAYRLADELAEEELRETLLNISYTSGRI